MPDTDKPEEHFGHIPERFREDYDPPPYDDPEHAGPSYRHVDPRDVLDPQEYSDWRRSQRKR